METERSTPTEEELRTNFLKMSITVGIGHGCATAPLVFASSILDKDVAYLGNGTLYICSLICALFISALVTEQIGVKGALILGQSLYSVYVLGFLLAASVGAGSSAQFVFFTIGSSCGGLAAGILWTAQGSFMGHTASAIAEFGSQSREFISAELAAQFAIYYLLFEEISKVLMSLFLSMSVSTSLTTCIYFIVSISSACAFSSLKAVQQQPQERMPMWTKAVGAMRLWSDVRIWLLSLTNITFGMSAAYMNGYFNQKYAKADLGSQSIGYLTAVTILVAAGCSKLYGFVGQRYGKGVPITLGAISFACIPLLLLLSSCKDWGWWLLIFYILQGSGRAVYESTSKATFCDTFKGAPTEDAFANCVLQMSFSSAMCFFMSAVFNGHTLEIIVLVFALLTPFAYAGKVLLEPCSKDERLPLYAPAQASKSA